MLTQENNCYDGSQCANDASVDSTGGTGESIEKKINQNNICTRNSNCQNNGGGGSSNQHNTCVNGSTCSNSGVDNENICAHGAACDNSGTNSKIISRGDPCENTASNVEVTCANGRIITRPLVS